MEVKAEFLFKLLGLGALVALINSLELADMIYKITRSIATLFEDIGAYITLGIIFYAINKFNKAK